MLNKISIALLATASVASLCMLPRTGTDAAKLLPAQVLVIAQEDGRITVESDNGASGSGTTLPDALAAMREGAEGTLFLDTAEHIILLQSTQSLLPAAVRQRQFRPAAKLYLARMDALDADGCVEFLQAHPGAVTLADAHAALLRGEALDPAILLPGENGGIILAGEADAETGARVEPVRAERSGGDGAAGLRLAVGAGREYPRLRACRLPAGDAAALRPVYAAGVCPRVRSCWRTDHGSGGAFVAAVCGLGRCCGQSDRV